MDYLASDIISATVPCNHCWLCSQCPVSWVVAQTPSSRCVPVVKIKDGGEICLIPWVRLCWRRWGPPILGRPSWLWDASSCAADRNSYQNLSLLNSSMYQMFASLGSGSQTNSASAPSCHHQCFDRKLTCHKCHWTLLWLHFYWVFWSPESSILESKDKSRSSHFFLWVSTWYRMHSDSRRCHEREGFLVICSLIQ